jgi:hypothetical protein
MCLRTDKLLYMGKSIDSSKNSPTFYNKSSNSYKMTLSSS